MKRVTILGATGSIGTQTLDVISQNPDDFEVVALTASESVEKMAELIQRFCPSYAVMKNEEKAEELRKLLPNHSCEILYGMDGFVAVSTLPNVDVVVAAMVGMIGLRPVMEAIRAGKDIALANKETLVTAGHIIMPLAKEYGVSILPVDSEHSAIFQCLNGEKKSQIETLFLTASGGPFRHGTKEELEKVTVEQALMHPNWSMGAKITIDSATMINKGLEMIEAKWLFDVDIDKIHVLVQPKSVIHSMVGFVDGAVMAQLGTPDMRLPIQYALYYPERNYLGGERLNFEALADIQFEKPNTDVLRGIPIAVGASRIGGSMLTAMNAANEYAVARFLKKDIAFLQIYDMIEYAMSKHQVIKHPDLSQILETERETYERLNKDWRNVSR
ncbi:1-deoxy-D-xylulose-5-phosphate reductoisomerase [Clostridium sp. AF37-5]|uniref:1-deoxy-D-xylulose-5-phosphate reductoisomerase n=1 Tax=Clostridium sp. AF37-5 TaxID=2293016 RepID=UPI000E48B234|nr:1-deoxy-D-xylulose-5-phosphate reductoisomerase [Clostridium sp. AF37-5]RHO99797.1 1-deoxy-D-xylulose-5-phosphate reductoisomerase [Clostridium sp. AF37-5]